MSPLSSVNGHSKPQANRVRLSLSLLFTFVLFVIAISPCRAEADGTPDVVAAAPKPLMDSFHNITQDSVVHREPTIAYNRRHDEYLLVWWSIRGGTYDISAQRVNRNGPIGGTFVIVSQQNQKNYRPDVAYNFKNDQYLIVYQREVTASDSDVMGRRVAWNGSWISQDIVFQRPAPTGTQGNQWEATVAYNETDNEYLVVYENMWSANLRDIDAQRVRGHDGALLSWRNIESAANTYRRRPNVVYNPVRNEYLIAYTYHTTPTADGDIAAKVATHNLGSLSAEINLVNNVFEQDAVSLAVGDDEYFAVWMDGPGSGHETLYGVLIDGTGAPGGYIPIVDNTGESHVRPAAAYSPFYGYTTIWQHNSGGLTGQDILGRTVAPNTGGAGDQFVVDDFSGQSQYPAIACSFRGDCLAAEEDDSWASFDIWVRMIQVETIHIPMLYRQ